MIFRVKRTSQWDCGIGDYGIDDTKLENIKKVAQRNIPCDGAEIHINTKKDYKGETYFQYYYTINIDTLEELLEFRKKLDVEIIINPEREWNNTEMYCIEIYDDYRE